MVLLARPYMELIDRNTKFFVKFNLRQTIYNKVNEFSKTE